MKTKQFILVILALVFVTNVFATETPTMNIIPLKDTKALIAVSQETPTVNEISIISENGEIMYFKESKKEITSYKQIFDLSQLENGTYEVKLKVGTTTIKNGLKINNGTVSVEAQKKEVDPVFTFANNKLKVSYLNFGKEDVAVCIYDKSQLIHKTELGNEFSLQRGFDLSKLEEGNYDVKLANASNKYWFSVTR